MTSDLERERLLLTIVQQAVSHVPSGIGGYLFVLDRRWRMYCANGSMSLMPDHWTPDRQLALGTEAMIVDATQWHEALAVGEVSPHASGMQVCMVPHWSNGSLRVLLCIEYMSTGTDEVWHGLIDVLVQSVALVVDQHGYLEERIRLVQEQRLFSDILQMVGGTDSVSELLGDLGDAVVTILPSHRWRHIVLSLFDFRDHTALSYTTSGRPFNAYWRHVNYGARMTSSDLGVELRFVGTTVSSAQQAEAIEQGIRDRVSGIAVAPIDAEALEPVIRRARQAGIPVIAFDTPPVADSQALLYIGTDNVAAGRLAGELLGRYIPPGGVVGVGVSIKQALNAQQRIAGFRDGIAAVHARILPEIEDQLDAVHSIEQACQQMVENPGLVGAFGVCSNNGPSWARAARLLGRSEQVKIVGFDIETDTIDLLKEGAIHAVIAQREYDMGGLSVRILAEMVVDGVGETLARYPQSRVIDTGIDVVTLDQTPWSIGITEHLQSLPRSMGSQVLRQKIKTQGRIPTIVVIGMAEQHEVQRAVSIDVQEPTSLLPYFADSEGMVELDLESPTLPSHAAFVHRRAQGIRQVVGVPLRARNQLLGFIELQSHMMQACSSSELAQFQRIADTIAVVLANARLIGQVRERRAALEQANDRQEQLLRTVMDLSSPVVPIAQGILVMPLVGSIDTQRAQRFLETLLSEVGFHQAQVVLIDITGVAVVDTTVADYLIRTAQSARLLGAEIVLVGITPSVAQTIVALGIDRWQIVTRADLESGFAYALARTSGRIVYDDRA